MQRLFQTLDALDLRLAESRFLFGPEPVETDWRLFTTLVRFDAVYQIHFKCSIRKLAEYEQPVAVRADLYQWPGIADTVDFDEIRAHYYRTHRRSTRTGSSPCSRPRASTSRTGANSSADGGVSRRRTRVRGCVELTPRAGA